jgi:tripartite-type tricarboxylate transporter receptor subunit TctC
VPGFAVVACWASSRPPRTPKAVVAKIQADTAKVLSVPDTRKRIEDLGMEVVTTRPEQFDALIQSEMQRWSRVITEAKIEVE